MIEDVKRRDRHGQVVERDSPPSEMELYKQLCRGHLKFKDIAESLGVSQTTARKRMEAIEVKLWADLSKHVLRIKVGQTEALKHAAQEVLESWERSKGKKMVIHTRGTKDGGKYTETQSEGDVKYITEFRQCLHSIRGIWGADSPKQVEIMENTEAKTTVQRLDEINQKMRELIPEAQYKVLTDDEESTEGRD